MKIQYEIFLINQSNSNENLWSDYKECQIFIQNEIFNIFGNPVDKFISKYKDGKFLEYRSEFHKAEKKYDSFFLKYQFRDGNKLRIGVTKQDTAIMKMGTSIEGELFYTKNIKKKDFYDICLKAYKKFPYSHIGIYNYSFEKEYGYLIEKNDSNYASENYKFLADCNWIEIYPPKQLRDKYYLPMDDDFYLNIPADKVEKLDNGSILVNTFKDVDAPSEEIKKKKIKVIDYYIETLKKNNLWRKIIWTPNWRNKYKDLLLEKGFKI